MTEGLDIDPSGSEANGIIEIDNNLPEYELALEFSDPAGLGGDVSQVTLEGLDGTLGKGLQAPVRAVMEPGGEPGRFLWRPGRQESATVRYRMRVRVTYAGRHAELTRLSASMPLAY